uniref:Protein pigeon n=1 Tax=Cacopsylla melanoneura TaxID=428564 RepID=A0A8D9F8S0_9HEMI
MENTKYVFEKAGNLHNLMRKHSPGSGKFQIIGHEKTNWLIVKWITGDKTKIGCYHYPDDSFQEMLSLKGHINVIQASINQTQTLISFVTRSTDDVYSVMLSQPWSYLKRHSHTVASMTPSKKKIDLVQQSKLQTVSQFVYRKMKTDSDSEEDECAAGVTEETYDLLIFVHHKSIVMYNCKVVKDNSTKEIIVPLPLSPVETLCTKPTWAQWDVGFQTLYFVYNKSLPPPAEGEEEEEGSERESLHPMLSALQFHDDLPHETVLNIPVNVPVSLEPFGGYLDDPVPLRIHDGSMDMIVLSDARGMVCVCHHYLYQVVQPPKSGCDTVHFAYSVILLHHSTMIHTSVTGVPYDQALDMRPTFLLIEDYLMIHAPGLFLHYLDVCLSHAPSAHIFLPSPPSSSPVQYIPLSFAPGLVLDVLSLSLFSRVIQDSRLIDLATASDCGLERKLAILHYFLVHRNNQAAVTKILEPLGETISDPNTGTILQEVLLAASYAATVATFNSDTSSFAPLLPYSVHKYTTRQEMKLSKSSTLSVAQDTLSSPVSVMLLSPQQRLNPYKRDVWNLLYEAQTGVKPGRFVPHTVVNKLLVSLHCYQPEALSRCTTPLSPSTTLGSTNDLLRLLRFKEPLPFVEKEVVTATRQEHITSVNLRELSIHLLKWSSVHGRNTKTPVFVHNVSTQYVATQVEVSRWLCFVVTSAARLKPSYTRGFQYIDSLTVWEARILFLLYDRFNSCCGCIGFPVPPGFTSFFAYLSYRTLEISRFLQYVERGVFELNIDVIKSIFADIPDDPAGVARKVSLLSLLPRSRIKRMLNHWPHPLSLGLRAREHALSVLVGTHASSQHRYARKMQGRVGVNSSEMLPCFDSFLRLLLAKVNLNELDVQLLLEATTTSLNLNNN